ncbi:alanine racemase [Planctobacterium marinum]|uniref:Alanine racemase n=1 Tax=Planctobacterium marinum TaxID=1631968 RepID=A0AA48HMA0_9ALTE|nr:alanine racemase [Planctobacterium marinum]
MTTLSQLLTPCLLLDEQVMQRNIGAMLHKAEKHNVRLRPHAKTAKCAEIMSRFYGVETALTVSTLREAEYFAEQGFKDLMYAVCISPDKFARVAQLRMQGVALIVILDSVAVADALVRWSKHNKTDFAVAIEIDCDGHRAGLTPDSDSLPIVAQMLEDAPELKFWGLMTHGGGAYDCASWQQVRQHASQERQALLMAKSRLEQHDIRCDNLSLGSTPTVVAAEHFAGVDEIRPGVFVFFDLFQAQLGACTQADIALSVLATVISHKPESNRIFLDAGGLALSKDRSTQGQAKDYGYGKLLNLDGGEFKEVICVSQVNQEHGVVQLPDTFSLDEFPIGSRVRILPNHACMTAAAYPGYHLIANESSDWNEQTHIQWLARCNGW